MFLKSISKGCSCKHWNTFRFTFR